MRVTRSSETGGKVRFFRGSRASPRDPRTADPGQAKDRRVAAVLGLLRALGGDRRSARGFSRDGSGSPAAVLAWRASRNGRVREKNGARRSRTAFTAGPFWAAAACQTRYTRMVKAVERSHPQRTSPLIKLQRLTAILCNDNTSQDCYSAVRTRRPIKFKFK